MAEALTDLIEAQDLNGLLRAVDGLVEQRDWDGLVDLADRCEDALERGKQLWPIAAHVDYRLALEAPGEYAADVLEGDSGRFALAPLTEVAAFNHTWAELAPHITSPVQAAYVAQERVLRGEMLEGDERAHPEALEMPMRTSPWEPTYALAKFRSNTVEVAEPWDPKQPLARADTVEARAVEAPEIAEVLLDLVSPWTNESNGAARVATVEGEAVAAASALTSALRIGPITAQEALQRMAWAAASGGAHGRRRGAAFGRFMGWYATAVLAGLRWPPDVDAFEAELAGLRFFRWDEGEPEEGWALRLVVEIPRLGISAAIAATDVSDDLRGAASE